MYIIDETYFQAPKREIANLNEADSRSFVELEQLIDEKVRLFLLNFLTFDEFTAFNSYLVDGIFPINTTGIPQKWIDLVNGKGNWKGLIYTKGTYKGSILADYVYYYWLVQNVSYMTGTGDTKANPKGASSVNPTQRIVGVWNDFVNQYQGDILDRFSRYLSEYSYVNNSISNEVYLMQFLTDNNDIYPNENRCCFNFQNQLGL